MWAPCQFVDPTDELAARGCWWALLSENIYEVSGEGVQWWAAMTAPIARKPFKRKRRLPLPEEVAVWIVLLIGAFTIGLGIGLDVGSPNCILPAGLLRKGVE